MLEEQNEVTFIVIDLVQDHHACVYHIRADAVESFIFIGIFGGENAVAFLRTQGAVELHDRFIHFNVAIDMDGMEACGDEGVGLILIGVDGSTDSFVLVYVCQVD